MQRPPVASSAETTDPSLFTPTFVALLLAVLAYFTAGGMEIPLAPLFAARMLGADEIGVGIAVGAVALTALFLRPIAGRTSDRRGRRLPLIGGALLYAAATAAHAVAPDLTVMVGLRLVVGVAEAFFFVAALAAMADLAPSGRTGEAMSFVLERAGRGLIGAWLVPQRTAARPARAHRNGAREDGRWQRRRSGSTPTRTRSQRASWTGWAWPAGSGRSATTRPGTPRSGSG